MTTNSWSDQRKALAVTIVFVLVPVSLLLMTTGLVSVFKNIALENFTRDPLAVTKSPFYIGAISKIGVLLWCAAACMCFLTAGVLRSVSASIDRCRFFLWAGVGTTVLLIDDFFLFHDVIAPEYFSVPSEATYTVYGGLAIYFFLKYQAVILKSSYSVLILATFFLSGSVGVDVLNDNEVVPYLVNVRDAQFLLEDGLKLFGIAGWFSYFAWECYVSLVQHSRQESAAVQFK